DVESGAREQLHRRVLQRPLRESELQRHDSDLVKQLRGPRWQPCASPSRRPFTSAVSSSQSTEIDRTASRLPDVPPFRQSDCRVREKNVTYPDVPVSLRARPV